MHVRCSTICTGADPRHADDSSRTLRAEAPTPKCQQSQSRQARRAWPQAGLVCQPLASNATDRVHNFFQRAAAAA